MDNIEQFSIYTAKVFEELYSAFPIPKFINHDEIIALHLKFDGQDEIKKLRSSTNTNEIRKMFGDCHPELGAWSNEDQKNFENAKAKLSDLENSKQEDICIQSSILKGTLEFLKDEGLVALIPHKGYRLTSKSFSHLNKTFEEATISEKDKSYITAIKSIFGETKSISRDVLVGAAITIIPKLLGYN